MSTDNSTPTIDAKTLETASDIQVLNGQGSKVRFGDIFANQKTITVFIRTYTTPPRRACSSLTPPLVRRAFLLWGKAFQPHQLLCFSDYAVIDLHGPDSYDLVPLVLTPLVLQQFVAQLSTVREDALKEADTRMVLVGCGDWTLIENYRSTSLPRPQKPSCTHASFFPWQKIPDFRERFTPTKTGNSTTFLA
jgi:hypothetical protein